MQGQWEGRRRLWCPSRPPTRLEAPAAENVLVSLPELPVSGEVPSPEGAVLLVHGGLSGTGTESQPWMLRACRPRGHSSGVPAFPARGESGQSGAGTVGRNPGSESWSETQSRTLNPAQTHQTTHAEQELWGQRHERSLPTREVTALGDL